MVALIDDLQLFTQKLIRIIQIPFVDLSHVDLSPRHLHDHILNLGNHVNIDSLTMPNLNANLKLKRLCIHRGEPALQL